MAILTHIRMNFPSSYTWIKTREIYCHYRIQEHDQYNYTITTSDIPITKFENRVHVYNNVNIHKGWVVLWWSIKCMHISSNTASFNIGTHHLFNINTLVPIQSISAQEPVCEYHIIWKRTMCFLLMTSVLVQISELCRYIKFIFRCLTDKVCNLHLDV